MNNTILINTLYLLIPFTLYGLIKFSIWWFKMVWTKPESFEVMMITCPLSATWAIYTLIMVHNKFPADIMPAYALWTIFAPISLIVSLVAYPNQKNRKPAMA